MRALLALALIGCAHAPDLPLRPDPSPPPGSTTEVVTAADGTQLLARRWAAQGDVRAVLVIMHGLKDYSARYASLASRATAAGYVVYAFDLRGHGRSAGPRVAPDDWNDYVVDLDRFLTSVEQREPGKPVFLLGHSMGGAIAARAAEVHRPALAGLILSGPAIAIDAPPLLVAATRMSGFLTPRFPAFGLDNHDFSSDPANAAAMDRDELISNPKAPARTAAGLVAGMHAIWRDVGQLTMPLLAMHGTADKLTAPSGSRALAAAAPAADKTLHIYDGYFHDLLHEPNGRGAQVEQDVLAWLGAHTGGPAVQAPPPYAGHLAGDPRGWTQAVDLAAGAGALGNDTGLALETEARLGRGRPLGWAGAIGARFAPSVWSLGARPLGLAVRAGGTSLGVATGAAWIVESGNDRFAISSEAFVEQPLGPLHLGVIAEHDARVTGTQRNLGPIESDILWLGGSLRLGRDERYWPQARAGWGPALIGGAYWAEATSGWFALLGLELYGAD